MILETIDLYRYFGSERGEKKGGYLHSYRHGQMEELGVKKVRPALLVIPGGGYAFLSQREGEPIALRFFAEGFDTFVLDYDLAPQFHYPTQLEQAAMAMVYLRREAERLDIDPAHVGAIGFSAGGHLCGCITLLWDDPAVRALFGDDCGMVRPDASVLSYAVVTAGKYRHDGSIRKFCADKVPPEAYSLEKRAREDAPPVFLWATTADDCVPVENSVMLYSALHEKGVPAELHVFAEGWHGLSTCDEEVNAAPPSEKFFPHVRHWMELAAEFFRARGFGLKTVK